MAEIRLNYTATQINNLLNKVDKGEMLTADEKNKLLNINLDAFVKDDDTLVYKIQNEIMKSGSYSSLKTTTTRIVLGRYIIRYNDFTNTLDFFYTDNTILPFTVDVGSVDAGNGQDIDSISSMRTPKMEIDATKEYSIHFAKAANNVQYFLYDKNGAFIKSSSVMNTTTEQAVKLELTNDTVFIRFKFTAPEGTVAAGFALADYIDLFQTLGTTVDSALTFEAGTLNDTDGTEVESTEIIRSADFIPVDANMRYILTTPEATKYFRYYFYDANKAFISRSESLTTAAGGSITIMPVTNAAFMKIKFANSESNQTEALTMAVGITLTQSPTESVGINWVQGEYDSVGVVEDSQSCVRTENPIPIDSSFQYSVTFPGDAYWFRYYFYTESGAFITRSSSMDVYANEDITITPPTNAVTMTMKFGTEDLNWETAKQLSANIVIKKIAK